ncbi:MAG: hypothetical protein Q8831_02350 ['Bonamia sp.' little leaf phytoplasma]|nr:hypothetical protein ['Bonamia sp.' little leaf phytoplasma]
MLFNIDDILIFYYGINNSILKMLDGTFQNLVLVIFVMLFFEGNKLYLEAFRDCGMLKVIRWGITKQISGKLSLK